MIFYGNGGFTWSDVMDMPVWLRVFYIKEINKVNDAKQKQQQKQQRKAATLSRPNITPRKS